MCFLGSGCPLPTEARVKNSFKICSAEEEKIEPEKWPICCIAATMCAPESGCPLKAGEDECCLNRMLNLS